MKTYRVLLAALASLGAACSTTHVPLRYSAAAPAGAAAPAPKIVAIGPFVDSRGRKIDADWLGAIRGGYGNPLKKLRTQVPLNEVVQAAFADGLRARGLLAEGAGGRFVLEGRIVKFDCSEYFNLEAHAHVDVQVLDAATHVQVFAQPFRVDQTEGGFGAGVFGSVETLRALAERALNELVDRVLDDPAFRKSLQLGDLSAP